MDGENMRHSYSMPCHARPLLASAIERSTTDPIKNIVSPETPSLCTEESRSSDSSESSLVNSPPFSSSMFRVGLTNRSSSTLVTASKEGVCRFLSKPCHLLLNVERGEEWALSGVVSVEVRRLNDGTSRLCATSTRSQRTLLRMPVVAGIEVRKSSSSNVEIVDQRAIAYRFLMDNVSEADELLSILSEEIQPRPSSPPNHRTNKSLASLSEAPDPKATRLASVTCKLFILRNSDHTWSKAGHSLLELFQQDSKPNQTPTIEAHKSTPNVRLLVRCLDSTRKIHFPPGSFRCERIAPLKITIVHLDHHHHTTTIMLQLKSKPVVESLIAWLIC
ncbi:hypothetical protein DSO57_1033920 [Entomophthora muscae]|uniref:Uncharacterized protein n=1 Tax=Entomophthora muscae TaxID=34485 RepID=A0ACC2REN3_9FUNG|nr:hypothetical protein DSO57_1033920 [Entomophthora muscae]